VNLRTQIKQTYALKESVTEQDNLITLKSDDSLTLVKFQRI